MGQGPGTKRINAQRRSKAKSDGAKYLHLHTRGYSVSAIARMCGVSKSTVSLRISTECESPAPDIEAHRALENAKYDAWERELHRLKRQKKADAEVVVAVHARLARIADLRIKLNGIAMPVTEKVQLEVTAGIASPSKAREAMRSAFGGIGPEGMTIGSDAVDDIKRVGPDGGERPRAGDPRKEPPAT